MFSVFRLSRFKPICIPSFYKHLNTSTTLISFNHCIIPSLSYSQSSPIQNKTSFHSFSTKLYHENLDDNTESNYLFIRSWDDVTLSHLRKPTTNFKPQYVYQKNDQWIVIRNLDPSIDSNCISEILTKVGQVEELILMPKDKLARVKMAKNLNVWKAIKAIHQFSNVLGHNIRAERLISEDSLTKSKENPLKENRVLLVCNLPPDWGWQELNKMFESFDLSRCTQIVVRENQVFGYVVLNSSAKVQEAIERWDGKMISGRKIHVRISTDYPRNMTLIQNIPHHVQPAELANEIKRQCYNVRSLTFFMNTADPLRQFAVASFLSEREAFQFKEEFKRNKFNFTPEITMFIEPFIGSNSGT